MTDKYETILKRTPEAADFDGFEKVCRHSRFIADWYIRYPGYLKHAVQSVDDPRDTDYILNSLCTDQYLEMSEKEFLHHLRMIKMREYTIIALNDLHRERPVEEITAHLSSLASASLEAVYRYCTHHLYREYGKPLNEEGELIGMSVIGLGKLGGWALNFSSDIDIIYVYGTEVGKTEGSPMRKPVDNHVFFTKLAEKITHYIGTRTEDGIVFRVDLRLRPDGDRGAITLPVHSYELYYESYGQGWERMMLLKARPVAGDKDVGSAFLKAVRPFVFRRSLDYKLLDELQAIKGKIDRREELRGSHKNVKLGYGGIREIEFIVQTFMILYYPKDNSIYHPNTLEGLARVVDMGLIDEEKGERLAEEYRFLRKLEHMAQIEDEKQTHIVPEESDTFDLYLERCGFTDEESFNKRFREAADFVHGVFSGIFEERKSVSKLTILFDQEVPEEDTIPLLEDMNINEPKKCAKIIRSIISGRGKAPRMRDERKILEHIIGSVVEKLPERSDPVTTLMNFEKLLSHQTNVYLIYDIISSAPAILDQMENIFSYTRYLANMILSDKVLLDYLYDPKNPVYNHVEVYEDLVERTEKYKGDTEYEMEIARQRHKAYIFNIGYAFLNNTINIIKVMRSLTQLARGTVNFAYERVLETLEERYGKPMLEDGVECSSIVVGMGKLGSYEMSFGSDLDLIVLYEGNGKTNGEKQITNHEFFSKAVQRTISFLGTYTTNGILYKIDMRLRPSGASGPLVTTLPAFREYQKKNAMLWEKQALARSCVLNETSKLKNEFLEIKKEVLFTGTLNRKEIAEVREMRERIEKEKGSPPEKNDIKAGVGGLLDIEFCVQMLQLHLGHKEPGLRRPNTHDVLSKLRDMKAIKERDYYALHDSYHFYRNLENILRVYENTSTSRLPSDEEVLNKAGVFFCYEKNSAECLHERYLYVRKTVRAAFNRIFDRYLSDDEIPSGD
ncbi:bifunctional [glutamate--ammonia ligase]-adenylyl-L-tyrosine phosphorylase/[glutamate--ammonia-ligase] adenylyltransferase [Limisalsivibrio acetivorans]|uniref:bifunctional [glutamate--ammonia ligase]-adenylyl-L-tyrosine phosphorylase/[glutamate--ammonia-ligase] adenylyltransferase n=1 Tax=Limisalsivibrio acetivorans TaxID=1304888 RepID=UPI0003B52FC2|nr:bifunctional [glutamate--ammonia ligase]-adenylyl-L-tyrosine phosphorylase/[glutamate--ammonia-ligase] adenylyltransferase [Limisalsivibrio acetivorans]